MADLYSDSTRQGSGPSTPARDAAREVAEGPEAVPSAEEIEKMDLEEGDESDERPNIDDRVLMLGRGSHDQALLERSLPPAGIPFEVFRDVESLAPEMDEGLATLVVGSESIKPRVITHLQWLIEDQPVWSDLPVIVMRGKSSVYEWVDEWMPRLGNVLVLDSPAKKATLLSTVQTALRDRARQYRFRRLLRDLHEAEEQKNDFLVRLGHEVRNPLGVITTSMSLLEELGEDGGAEGGKKARDKILRQTRVLARLIDDILHVSSLTVGKVPLDRRSVELREVVDLAFERFALGREAEQRGVELTIEGGTVEAQADPDALEQVLYNLVQDAFSRVSQGGRVRVETGSEGEEAFFAVTADGDSAEVGEADDGESRLAGGSGAGLSLLRSVVELQGGVLEVEEEDGRIAGPARVRLPRTGKGRGVEGGERKRVTPKHTATVDNPHILVVEDNTDGREALQQLLEVWDYEVTVASNGEEARAALDEVEPGVALLDIGLPDTDGYQLAELFRERLGSSVRLIAMTGYGQPEDRKKALESGFDLHLVKPVEPSELFELLSDLVERPG